MRLSDLHAIVVSLPSRQDRRDAILPMLKSYGMQYDVLWATEHAIPAVGCARSHAAAVRRAFRKGWREVLVLEDDFEFQQSRRVVEAALSAFFVHPASEAYAILQLAKNVRRSEPVDDLLERVREGSNAAGYVVAESAMSELADLIEAGAERLARGDGTACNDVVWSAFQDRGQFYAFRRAMGRQRPGYSDIQRRKVDYGC